MRSILPLTLVLSMLASVGCGTSQVLTDEPTARIWANGRMIGKGHGEIQQYGMWETTSILVKAEDGRQQTTTVNRRITGVTVLGALITYGTCLLFCWSYPDTIWAGLPARAASPYGMPGGVDPWLLPPPGWQPRTPAPSPSATPPAADPNAPPPTPTPTPEKAPGPVPHAPSRTTPHPS